MIVNEEWLLLPERIALHLPTATAVIADLHLGYNETRRQSGEAVPLVTVDEVLAPLGHALERHDFRKLVIAGDLFEAGYLAALASQLSRWLTRSEIELVGVVPGNHDCNLDSAPWPLLPDGILLGQWRILHGDLLSASSASARLVHGHWHPSYRWQGRKRPCFLFNDTRLVLPAFSADAAGALPRHIPDGNAFRCVVIDDQRLIEVRRKSHALSPKRRFKASWQ